MIILANEHASGGFADDAYISALENAEIFVQEDWPEIDEWLEENMNGHYDIRDDYDQKGLDVNCIIYIDFELPTDEIAFKLRWI